MPGMPEPESERGAMPVPLDLYWAGGALQRQACFNT
jgi:hypothetical protein